MNILPIYEYKVGGSLPADALTYVEREEGFACAVIDLSQIDTSSQAEQYYFDSVKVF